MRDTDILKLFAGHAEKIGTTDNDYRLFYSCLPAAITRVAAIVSMNQHNNNK